MKANPKLKKIQENCLIILMPLLLVANDCMSQSYTSYFTGNAQDTVSDPSGGICLMGGATENDEAMKWFLQRASGGDILVLRTSGSDGYNNYLYSELGIPVNSVETIVFNEPIASYEPYIAERITKAEGIWFAGGDQWDYVTYWRSTPVDSLVNEAIEIRNIIVGGTSAGMAILGQFYFSAQNGTVTSVAALSNPYHPRVTVDSVRFIQHPKMSDIITDTHYDNPDRRGRHVVFLARILMDYGIKAKGIACDEYTAVCIGDDGIAHAYGEYPAYDDNAYFIQTNCELADVAPEVCSPGNPLTWDLGGKAIKTYAVKGTFQGTYTFDLNDWETGSGGTWEDWSVNQGVLTTVPGDPIHCNTGEEEIVPDREPVIHVYPNPGKGTFYLKTTLMEPAEILITDLSGTMIKQIHDLSNEQVIDLSAAAKGEYIVRIKTLHGTYFQKIILN